MNFFGKPLLVTTLAWLLCGAALAQIQITFPSSRAVFQRDNANRATVSIAGTYAQYLDKLEARFAPRVSGQGAATSWTTIQTNPTGGIFSGSLSVSGGWYQLEVRGWLNNSLVATTTLDRVGVGEVFAFIGHSNAQGAIYPSVAGTDDRVSCVPFDLKSEQFRQFNASGKSEFLPARIFAHLSASSGLAPYSGTPWIWGRLGDLLTRKLNVPVLFYAAGFGGTSTEQWYQSAAGISFSHLFVNSAIGMPYVLLKDIFNFYVPTTGIRAVLSIHGENDREKTTAQILANTRFLISKNREDAAKPRLAWVVARSSYLHGVATHVTDAQNGVISSLPDVFSGPNLDQIAGPENRPDGLHYGEKGQILAVQFWSDALNADFFTKSQPYAATPPPIPTVSCASTSGNTILLTLPGNFTSYTWSGGQTTPTLTVPATGGTFSARLSDGKGNFYLTPPLTFSPTMLQDRPTLTADGPLRLCAKTSVNLISSSPSENIWSTGATTRSISITDAGSYSVGTKNVFGCLVRSVPVIVTTATSSTLPAPGIAASGATAFCEGSSVTLTSGYAGNTIWSNGSTGRTLTVSQPGAFSARSIDAGGCGSAPSAAVAVTVYPLPSEPLISSDKVPSLCQGSGTITLTASSAQSYLWNNGATTKSIIVANTGTYSVRVTDSRRCQSSASAEMAVNFRALPDKPNLLKIGTYTLRATAANATDYEWKRNDEVITFSSPWIKASTNGVYSVRARAEYPEAPPLIKLVCFSSVTDSTIAFTDESANQGLSIYPNPSRDGFFTIETKRNLANGEITIYNLAGQEVYHHLVNGFEERLGIDLSRQPGLYLMRVKADGFAVTKRIVCRP
ncbi:MAG: T9SS type A sorting domain-containing protein [Cytophagaceae bacterium]|nr:T9SS type A sorting domain-containing protein [Cytophagaceae bacterium]